MSECDGKHWEKRGLMLSCSIFLDHVTRGYGLRLRTSREEDEMTTSNTRTVRSGRFLTASSIRWSRFFMTAHSYAVTFHCILITTWLNQARTTLLITQDKKTRQCAGVVHSLLVLYPGRWRSRSQFPPPFQALVEPSHSRHRYAVR